MKSAFDLLKSAYKGKHVLITGHTGFKGSWLSIWLNKLGAEVIGYALDPYTPRDNFVLSKISNSIIDIRGDIRDFNKLKQIFQKYKPEFAFHLAAQSLVREGYEKPKETYDINVGGTVNILENCRESDSIKAVIIATSDKCYKNYEWIWGYRENDPMGGNDPYSSSKGCAELITSAYRNSFFDSSNSAPQKKALSSVRAGNVIGGGDWSIDRIIPDCIRALENNEPIKVRNPYSTRPWQYVLEPLGGYLLLGARMAEEPKKYSGAWNFGPDVSSIISVKELVELVLRNWGGGSWVQINEANKPHEARLLALDISKARFELGWKPCMAIDESVKNTIAWHKSAQSNKEILEFCKTQIKNYIDKMQIQ